PDSRSASARSDSGSASARLDSRSASARSERSASARSEWSAGARSEWNLALGDGSPSIDLASTARALQPDRVAILLDASGKRGLVLFHHETHEGRRFRPEALPRFLNKPSESSACVQCHHRNNTDDPARPDTTDLTNRLQFQKCINCHRSEGDPKNF